MQKGVLQSELPFNAKKEGFKSDLEQRCIKKGRDFVALLPAPAPSRSKLQAKPHSPRQIPVAKRTCPHLRSAFIAKRRSFKTKKNCDELNCLKNAYLLL